MLRTAVIALSLALLGTACSGEPLSTEEPDTPNPDGTPARLAYAFDGDSIEVDIDGRTEEVRLLGINAPEGDECYGKRAREALIDLLAGQDFVLVEGTGDDTDRYGRLLRYVYVDGENTNGRLLAGGHALTLQGDHRFNSGFVEIGDLAAGAGLGMWAPDACGPAPQSGAAIVEVRYNPPGPDDERLNDEYVVISNEGTTPLNLAGWTLRDESSHNRYAFNGPSLEPGMSVTVRTGCGEDRTDAVYWCADRPIWSNGGDTAILQDPHGNVVNRWTYAGR